MSTGTKNLLYRNASIGQLEDSLFRHVMCVNRQFRNFNRLSVGVATPEVTNANLSDVSPRKGGTKCRDVATLGCDSFRST
jgi:hypothetical protein